MTETAVTSTPVPFVQFRSTDWFGSAAMILPLSIFIILLCYDCVRGLPGWD